MSKQLSNQKLELIIDELSKNRKSAGISHEKLAEKMGVHRSSISLIESKKRIPTLLTCLKYAAALNIKLSEVLAKVGC